MNRVELKQRRRGESDRENKSHARSEDVNNSKKNDMVIMNLLDLKISGIPRMDESNLSGSRYRSMW